MLERSRTFRPVHRNAKEDAADSINWRAFDYYPRLRRVRDHLVQHISEPLSTTAAARIACLNASYFSSFFRSKVGARYTDWARHVRIERAMEILKSEDRSIREAAQNVGYTGLRTFERAFKRHTSITPSEFKRRVRPAARRPHARRREARVRA
jgi:two-component system response regulator YesN